MARRNWTRSEQVLALELYLRTPFGRIHSRNPEIISLAKKIGRSANALSLKMVNFAALDPTIHQKGMSNYSKADAEIWAEFFDAPSTFLSNINLENMETIPALTYTQNPQNRSISEFEVREGTDVERLVKTRKNQNYFRKMLLASYDNKCAVTEIEQTELLIAGHIVPWRDNEESRLDPRNGILLNSLHDRAFDSGYITFDEDLTLIASKHLHLSEIARPFFENKKLKKPRRFAPNPDFLAFHRDNIFEKFLN